MHQQHQLCVQRLPFVKEHCDNLNVQHAAFFSSKVWPTHVKVITVAFLNQPGTNFPRTTARETTQKAAKDGLKIDPLYATVDAILDIRKAVQTIIETRIAPLIGVRLAFLPEDRKHTAMVRIAFNPFKGSWSYVGTDAKSVSPNEPTLNFAWFDVATVLHEFCHALGMVHEHQNVRNGIVWDDERVYEWAEDTHGWTRDRTYRNIIRKYQKSQINASEFDSKSIMLYYFPRSLTLNTDDPECRQNFRLSRGDVDFITQIYPGGLITPDSFFADSYGEEFHRQSLAYRHKTPSCFLCPTSSSSKRVSNSTPTAF
jgi:hypothetical protein